MVVVCDEDDALEAVLARPVCRLGRIAKRVLRRAPDIDAALAKRGIDVQRLIKLAIRDDTINARNQKAAALALLKQAHAGFETFIGTAGQRNDAIGGWRLYRVGAHAFGEAPKARKENQCGDKRRPQSQRAHQPSLAALA